MLPYGIKIEAEGTTKLHLQHALKVALSKLDGLALDKDEEISQMGNATCKFSIIVSVKEEKQPPVFGDFIRLEGENFTHVHRLLARVEHGGWWVTDTDGVDWVVTRSPDDDTEKHRGWLKLR
jgi:hypothetical protein